MELTVLGSHGTWPGAGGATSGLLAREDGFSVWVDAGSGTLANLQRHIGLYDVDAIVISHSHPDHVSDLYAYFYSRLFGPEPQPAIPLYVAPRVIERANPLLTDDSGDIRLAEAFDIVVVEPGQEHHVGPLRMTSAPMAHSVPTIGVRLDSATGSLVYSADTGPSEDLVRLAAGADLFVVEASWQGERGDQAPIHLTATEAGQAGARAAVDRLLLTHIRPYMDVGRSLEEAARMFDGDLRAARDNETQAVRP